MSASLVGSEMCIRDRDPSAPGPSAAAMPPVAAGPPAVAAAAPEGPLEAMPEAVAQGEPSAPSAGALPPQVPAPMGQTCPRQH
eukprot:4226734-Alexandrium_andersonii.AAC.1